jgi:RNA polymerase sigma-70 factor (ECF subfamily)
MKSTAEAQWLADARRGDLQSLGLIYDQYSPGLYRYAMRLLGDDNLAEDCVADTFERFLKALQAGGGPQTHLQAYLYRVAHNWITDFYRRSAAQTLDLDDNLPAGNEHHPEHHQAVHAQQAELRRALRALTPAQRQVIVLRFVEGWENEAVAQALQRPVGAIKALQHRALQVLRRILPADEESTYESESTPG